MPLLRNVLSPRLSDVIHHDEGQSVCVWPAELICAGPWQFLGTFPDWRVSEL